MFRHLTTLCLLLTLSLSSRAADWPQWRGPDRDNISKETGLLKAWPAGGPPLLWKAEGLGEGVPPVAVAGGKVFVLGYRDDKEHLTALNEKDGKPAWSVPIGPKVNEMPAMRWLSQRTPTVDGERVYVVTARGELICLATADGKEQWRIDYVKEFKGKRATWGYCDFPLVDGDRLICTPGGAEATMAALDKKTGKTIWKCVVDGSPANTYSAVVPAQVGDLRMYINQLQNGVVGVAAKDGKLLWHYKELSGSTGMVHTAIVRGDEVFASNGWGVGAALLQLTAAGADVKVEEKYRAKSLPFESWLGSSVRLGDRVHDANGMCVDWKTGKRIEIPDFKPGRQWTMTCADGRLYFRTGKNVVTLMEVAEDGKYVKRGEFTNDPQSKEPTWTFPVISGGRLYLRDQNVLLCYNVADPKARRRGPDVIFVPTPQDVVEKMLELAGVKKADVVVDLGCGDGRIVVTAAKKYGCQAIGYDLDEECIKLSQEAVKKEGVEKLVRIEKKDIFEVDLSAVSVVTLYLGPELNAKLIPQLEKMKPGARIVSHAFPMPGMKPDKVIEFTSAEDDVERKLYLWTVPLKKEEKKDERE